MKKYFWKQGKNIYGKKLTFISKLNKETEPIWTTIIINSPVDAWLSKMEVAIENIVSLAATGNLVVNQLMEHEAVAVVSTKVVSTKEPKWTTMIAKNMR